MADYVRQLPHQGSADMARPPSAATRFHIDVPLLLLLTALTLYGLFVLYSASGQDMGAVVRQGRYFIVAYVVMILAAQVSLERYMRWAPWLYLVGLASGGRIEEKAGQLRGFTGPRTFWRDATGPAFVVTAIKILQTTSISITFFTLTVSQGYIP